MNNQLPPKFLHLNEKIVEVIDNFNLVQYQTLNIQDEESIDGLIAQMDSLVQYDEFRLPREDLLPNEDQDGDNANEDHDMEY